MKNKLFFLFLLVIILAGLLIYFNKIYEKFENDPMYSDMDINIDSMEEINIVNCTKYPNLCSVKTTIFPYEPYLERRVYYLNKLKNMDKRFYPGENLERPPTKKEERLSFAEAIRRWIALFSKR